MRHFTLFPFYTKSSRSVCISRFQHIPGAPGALGPRLPAEEGWKGTADLTGLQKKQPLAGLDLTASGLCH